MRSRIPLQDTRSFFNPGFIALNIYALALGYTKNEGAGIPIPLVYVGIPLCLHTNTRSVLPATASKRFHLWVQENQQILIGFGDRAAAMKQRVDLGIMFGCSASLIELTDAGKIISLKKPKGFSSKLLDGDPTDCFIASKRLGQMFSRIPKTALVYYMLGVRP